MDFELYVFCWITFCESLNYAALGLRVLRARAAQSNLDPNRGSLNTADSSIYDMLRVTILFDMYDTAMYMIFKSHM